MDLAKYRALFLEEAGEHLAEMSRGLLALEKDPRSTESLDLVFRMAHSIKGMAASIGYDAIAELAHRLEDAIDVHRAAGGIEAGDGCTPLFRGLEGLERMVAAVRETGDAPAADLDPMDARESSAEAEPGPPKKAPN